MFSGFGLLVDNWVVGGCFFLGVISGRISGVQKIFGALQSASGGVGGLVLVVKVV